jgi:hypothetical protein
MAYVNNTPQANQTISFTQPILEANCNYLQTAIGTEHNFDTATPGNMYHLQASMPNRFTPVSLPTGTQGMYYVRAGIGRFFDGTNEYTTSVWQTLKGTFTSANSSAEFTIVAALPSNSFGFISIYRSSAPILCSSGQFVMSGTTVYGYSNRYITNGSSVDNSVELQNTSSTASALTAKCASSTFQNKLYNYFITYRPA